MNANNAIEVKNLKKEYKGFSLDVSFTVPKGLVTGFIGRNGAGKTTTLKCLLSMLNADYSEALILGKPISDATVKEDLGILFDQPYYQEDWNTSDIEKALKPYYTHWDSYEYKKYLDLFQLPQKKKFKTFSRGMKMKLGIATSLSHNAKLLLLDEPTGGLDPVVRDEILELMHEYLIDENHTIFFSTHITSDLDKIADKILFISNGKIIFDEEKDVLLDRYVIARGSIDGKQFDKLISINSLGGLPSSVVTEKPTLDDIIVYFERGKI